LASNLRSCNHSKGPGQQTRERFIVPFLSAFPVSVSSLRGCTVSLLGLFEMFSSALLSLLSIPLVAALPATPFYKEHATHYTRSLPNGSKLKTYHPRSRFETYGNGLQRRGISSSIDPSDYRTASLQFVHSKLGEDEADLEIVSEYEGPHSTHVWVSQKIVSKNCPDLVHAYDGPQLTGGDPGHQHPL